MEYGRRFDRVEGLRRLEDGVGDLQLAEVMEKPGDAHPPAGLGGEAAALGEIGRHIGHASRVFRGVGALGVDDVGEDAGHGDEAILFDHGFLLPVGREKDIFFEEVRLHADPEGLAAGHGEKGLHRLGEEVAAAVGGDGPLQLFLAEKVGGEPALRLQGVDTVGEEDQVGAQPVALVEVYGLQQLPAGMVPAHGGRQGGEGGEARQPLGADTAVQLRVLPVELADQTAVHLGGGDAAVMEKRGAVELRPLVY
jgi:hypothetical protein